MTVREAAAGDAATWALFRSRLWPEARTEKLADEVLGFLNGETVATIHAAFLAIERDTPVGFLELAIRPFSDGCESAPVPHVEGWYVEPTARGRGAGRALLVAAEDWARNRGFTELASDSEIHNSDSIAAHERCGFVEVERLVKFCKSLG